MLNPETYKIWAGAFSAESQYRGEWKENTYITFFDPNLGGTKALLEVVRPFEHILARHAAIIHKDGSEDRDSDVAKKWIGVSESYQFEEDRGSTQLSIEIITHDDFEKMFDDSWPKALSLLKELCEKKD